MRFNIDGVRFPNGADKPAMDKSSLCIVRDPNKCILCGDCVRMCNEIQNVGAIDFAHRGSKMTISTVFDIPIAESNCVGCGQCTTKCKFDAIHLERIYDGEGVSFEKMKPVVLKTMLKREGKIAVRKVKDAFSKKD